MYKNTFNKLVNIIATLILFILILNMGLIYYKDQFNKDIKEFISEELALAPDTIDDELVKLDGWARSFWSTEENRGLLYERMSNIYLWKGDTLNYYSSLGSSLYYLERSKNYTTLVNLYADLANFYILNGEMNLARDQLNLVNDILKINSDLVNDQMKCYLKRIEGQICFENKEYNVALERLKGSDTFVVEEEGWGLPYLTINAVNKAKCYLALGDLSNVEKCLKLCEDSGFLDIDVYVSIFKRDLLLPYYQVKCIYDEQTKGEAASRKDVEDLIDIASDGGWQNCAIDTLSSLYAMDVSDDYSDYISNCTQGLYVSLAESQTENYVFLTNSQVQSSKENALRENLKKGTIMRDGVVGGVFLIIVLTLLLVINKIIRSNYTDGLTKISNRKALDRRLARLKKSGEDFVFVMIDIDNFKKVNDTYGHESGDLVLKNLGKLLREKYSNNNLQCYRYGGEEFSIIIRNCPVDGAVVIMDSVRKAFANINWSFKAGLRITLSIGVAASSDAEDVVKAADDNLYKAKTSGKNQVYAGR